VVNGLAPGSYLLEVSSPDYFYEPVRIDINSKGKIRARKVNNVQPSQVTQVKNHNDRTVEAAATCPLCRCRTR
jgi:hypothetical protein